MFITLEQRNNHVKIRYYDAGDSGSGYYGPASGGQMSPYGQNQMQGDGGVDMILYLVEFGVGGKLRSLAVQTFVATWIQKAQFLEVVRLP